MVTGAAGFIGFHVCQALIEEGHEVFGVDNFNPYYDVRLKHARASLLMRSGKFTFFRCDILDSVFDGWAEVVKPDCVIHLAAQAGVRHSLEHPEDYVPLNIDVTDKVFRLCQKLGVSKVLYASSSSVYGGEEGIFREGMRCDKPPNLYAATKRSCELLAQAYCATTDMTAIGLRFFTVYGPWGRPDMALYKFTEAVAQGKKVQLYNYGKHSRCFTYVKDVAQSVVALLRNYQEAVAESGHEIYNVGTEEVVPLVQYLQEVQNALGKAAIVEMAPLQKGDMVDVQCDNWKLHKLTGYSPSTPVSAGVAEYVKWFRGYYK